MSVHVAAKIMQDVALLRHQPTEKRVRVLEGGTVVADTRGATLIWEPRRVVASYAVPESDIRVDIRETESAVAAENPVVLGDGPPVLDPSTGFGFHTSPGTAVQVGNGLGYRLDDADLAHLIVLDFDSFDWLEEEEPIFGHPRDPFSRIDLRQSARNLRIELEGRLLAETTRPLLLFESLIPARYYIPRDDVRVELTRSATDTVCAYKGHATHWHVSGLGNAGADIAWSYENPPPELTQVAGLVCFYQERVDMTVDGVLLQRPTTPWSPRD